MKIFRPSIIIFLVVMVIGIINVIPTKDNLWSMLLILLLSASVIALIIEWILKIGKR